MMVVNGHKEKHHIKWMNECMSNWANNYFNRIFTYEIVQNEFNQSSRSRLIAVVLISSIFWAKLRSIGEFFFCCWFFLYQNTKCWMYVALLFFCSFTRCFRSGFQIWLELIVPRRTISVGSLKFSLISVTKRYSLQLFYYAENPGYFCTSHMAIVLSKNW